MSQHLRRKKCLHASHCAGLMRKGEEIPVPRQASLQVFAVDDRLQGKSLGISNLKHISKSVWLIAVTVGPFC